MLGAEGVTANVYGDRISFWGDENVLVLQCSWLHNFVNTPKTAELYTLRHESYGIWIISIKKPICPPKIKSANKKYTQRGIPSSLLFSSFPHAKSVTKKPYILCSYSKNDRNPKNILTSEQKAASYFDNIFVTQIFL